jgi:hypothetical protein
MALPQVADRGKLASMECSYSREQQTRGGSPAWGMGEVLTPHRKKLIMLRNIQRILGIRLMLRYDLLKLIFVRLDGGGGGNRLDQSGSQQGLVAGSCECGDKPSGSIKCGEFLRKC